MCVCVCEIERKLRRKEKMNELEGDGKEDL